jgi:hypothetical protein
MSITPVKISALPEAADLDGTELVPVVQAGTTKKTTAQDIADLGGGGGGSVFVANLIGLGSQTMDDNPYYYLAASEVLLASDDVEYVDGVDGVSSGFLQFNNDGTYEIQIRVQLSGDWPNKGQSGEPAFYGLVAGGQDVAKFSRSVYLGAANDGTVGWSSQLVRQMAATDTLFIGPKVACYNFTSRTVIITAMQVTVKKIGDYTP